MGFLLGKEITYGSIRNTDRPRRYIDDSRLTTGNFWKFGKVMSILPMFQSLSLVEPTTVGTHIEGVTTAISNILKED